MNTGYSGRALFCAFYAMIPSLTVGEKKNPEKRCTARLFGVRFIKKVLYGIIISEIFLSADSVP
jgi:hypothetical protein